MEIKSLTVAGGGVLGSQIAFQSAFKGLDVTVWARSEESKKRVQDRFDALYSTYKEEVEKLRNVVGTDKSHAEGILKDAKNATSMDVDRLLEDVERAYKEIKIEIDLEKAVKGRDLVIESVSENKDLKIEFYKTLAPLLDEGTIIATNTSSLVPSWFMDYTGIPDKFLALHFANRIWVKNPVEIMVTSKTDEKYPPVLKDFALKIGMVPIMIKKEVPGYVMNSLLIPFLMAAMGLLANGVADAETIDKDWKLTMCAPIGPFEELDYIGVPTAYHVVKNNPQSADPNSTMGRIKAMLENMIKEGKTGREAGEGFYKY